MESIDKIQGQKNHFCITLFSRYRKKVKNLYFSYSKGDELRNNKCNCYAFYGLISTLSAFTILRSKSFEQENHSCIDYIHTLAKNEVESEFFLVLILHVVHVHNPLL